MRYNLENSVEIKMVFLIFLGMMSWGNTFSQPLFEHITSEDGLSENVVNDIFQDSKGFMWFGTNDGLNKYDGYQFTIYKSKFSQKETISSNLIYAITEDTAMNIWIGTTGSGLSKFNAETEEFTNYAHDSKDETSLSNNLITALFTDSRGRIWIGTSEELNVIDPSATPIVFHKYPIATHTDIKIITKIREDKKGNIWVSSREGLFTSYPSETLNGFSFERKKIAEDVKYEAIVSFDIDESDRLVVLSYQGLFIQNEGHEISFSYVGTVDNARDILFDNQNKIWVGSDDGLSCFEIYQRGGLPKLKKHFKHDNLNSRSLSKNLVSSLFRDSKGIIWVAINGGGLDKFNPNRKAFNYIGKLSSHSGSSELIRAVLEDSNGTLWVGTEGDGLFCKDVSNKKIQEDTFEKINIPTRPFALEEVVIGEKKWLFIGSQDAPNLHRIDITDNKPKSPEPLIVGSFPSVFSLLQDYENNIWIGTYNDGLHRWKPNADGSSFEKTVFKNVPNDSLSLSNNIIRKLLQDSRGNIWVGTGDGLNKISAHQLNNAEIDFEIYRNKKGDKNSLSHNYILDILESMTGEIWIGTFGGGLNKFVAGAANEPPQFEHFTEADGLANNTIKSILEDKTGKLWLSSNRGLTKLDPNTDAIFNYDLTDGLQGIEFSEIAAVYRKNGEMIFGGTNGLNTFFPEEIELSLEKPKVTFTELFVFNNSIHPQKKYDGRVILDKALPFVDQINLKYNENNFSLEFASLDYTAPHKIQYSYLLEGYDDEWKTNTTQNRLATYTNLRHGDYTLKVKATNADGIWGEEIKEMRILISPPIWLAWYAYVVYFATAVGLLWFFRRYELIGIQEKHDLRMTQLERQKKEEIHDLKLRFFTNISHEFRTPLTLIIAPLENLIKQGKNISNEKAKEQYHLMYKNSKYLLRLVNQLLDFRRLDQGQLNLEVRQGDFVEFVKEASQPFQFIASKQNVDFKVESEDKNIYLWFDTDVVEKILYNLISNAFKHTPAGGQIIVKLSEVEEEQGTFSRKNDLLHYLKMEVIDTGEGISSKVKRKIFERFYKEDGDKFTNDGAGIGLSFTESLVKRHYGEIKVESKKGVGSKFIIKLPLKKSTFAKSEIADDKAIPYQFETDPLEYFTPEKPDILPEIDANVEEKPNENLPLLLFVDDNEDIRKFLKIGFENDFRIIEAENGLKGLEIAKSSLPDIIISDIMMPEMDGIELCKTLKANMETSHIPIVLLTAKTTSETELEGLGTGADAFVRKPFKLDILQQQILNIYQQREKLKSRFRKEAILQPKEITVTTVDEEFLQRAMDLIEEHMSDADFNVEALVKEMYISRSKLYLKVKALTGYSTSEFIRTVRLKRAVQLLEKSDFTIKEIMFMTGFNTASYFSKCFKKIYGIVPSEYVRNKREQLAKKEKSE